MKKFFLLLTVCIVTLFVCSCDKPFEKYKATEGGEIVYSVQKEEISAVASNGYRFVRWSDGVTEPHRVYGEKIEEDVTAEFEPISVTLRNEDKEDVTLTLAELAESELSELMPSAEGVYYSFYTSEEICELFGLDGDSDVLSQIKERYLTLGISDVEDIVLDAKIVFYLSGEGGTLTKTEKGVSAVSDNGYRFVKWSDGVLTPDREYDTTLEEDVTAEFEPIYVVLREGEDETRITLSKLSESDVLTLMPDSDEEVYLSSYSSKYVCELFDLDERIDALAQIKEIYLDDGISDTEDIVLYARYIFYFATEGGTLVKTEEGILALPDNGYRFAVWSDEKTSAERDDYFLLTEASFKASFESIKVNMYAEGELINSLTVSEFVELGEDELTLFIRGKIFENWVLESSSELFEVGEDIVAQIKSFYSEEELRGEADIVLGARFTDKRLKDFYQFKTIAHALGGAPWLETDATYLNCLEVFTYHYNRGQRFFEIDLALTMEGKVVAAHHYDTPIYYDEFMATKREGFTPIDIDDLVDMMIEYPEIRVDLDILGVYRSAYEGTSEEKLTLFYDLLDDEIRRRATEDESLYDDIYDRFVLEIFFDAPLESVMFDLARNEKYGFVHFMFSGVGDQETPMGTLLEDLESVCIWCVENGVFMMSTKIVDEEFIAMTDRYDIFTFAYTFNSEEYILELLERGVDCVFTDFVYL